MSKNTQQQKTNKIEDTKEVSNKTEIPSASGAEKDSDVVTHKLDPRIYKGIFGRCYGDASTKRVRPMGSGPLAPAGQQAQSQASGAAKAGVATVGKKTARKTLISSLNRVGKGDRFAAAVIATKKMDSIINKRKAKPEKPASEDEEEDKDKPGAERPIVRVVQSSSSAPPDLAPMKRARSNTIRKRRS